MGGPPPCSFSTSLDKLTLSVLLICKVNFCLYCLNCSICYHFVAMGNSKLTVDKRRIRHLFSSQTVAVKEKGFSSPKIQRYKLNLLDQDDNYRFNVTLVLFMLHTRLLARWESRSPIDGHFSEKISMNDCTCIQRFFLANLEIFRYLCTHNCRKTPCMLLRPSYEELNVRPYKNCGLPLFKSWLKACCTHKLRFLVSI